MKTVNVEICSGTACYVMGGSELLQSAAKLPAELVPVVKVTGALCLDLCKCGSENGMRPPFVRINDKVFTPQGGDELIRLIRDEASV